MARHRQKTPPVTDERARLATARETRKAAAGRFAGCWPSCKLRAVTGVYFWRGGRNQSNGGAETASLSTTEKRRVTEQRKYLEITRLGGEARSREQHKHPKRRFAHRTAAWASLRSNGEAETKDAARAEEQREKEEVWRRTSDEKALPSRPPCGDTVSSLALSALDAAGASPTRPGAGGSLGGLQRAAACRVDWAGLTRCVACMYEYSRATGLYHKPVPGGTYRQGAELMLVEQRRGPQQARRRPIGRGQGQLLQSNQMACNECSTHAL
ncbi:hypothetical protein TASIC1_0011011600 [Trichoderma asperellum]|uniref:Uncharacterized protein n=1 Tax=Trichoderma asperellum TaxID=101201 RepID=A0A6V8R1N3_TRIAP|nr:hypothetical protein TASIC1_0011011600 [Trichoderma asperellum]